MGHKEKTLEDLIALADERISTLRQLLKDTKRAEQEAKNTLAKRVDDLIGGTINAALREMYRAMAAAENENLKIIAANLQAGYDVLRAAAFGTCEDPRQIGRAVMMIKALAQADAEAGTLGLYEDAAETAVVNMMRGARPFEELITPLHASVQTNGTPHALVQDEPSQVG